VRVGMEATGHARWFERLLAELGLWIGDPAEIKTKRVRKQKTDREDARLMLKLLRENRFPKIWVPGMPWWHYQRACGRSVPRWYWGLFRETGFV
jgi:transposase